MKIQYKLLLSGLLLTTAFAADSEYDFDGDEKNQQSVQADVFEQQKKDLGIKQAVSEFIPENEENARPDPESIVIKDDSYHLDKKTPDAPINEEEVTPPPSLNADEVTPVVQPEVTPLSDELEQRYADESERQRRVIDAQIAADIQEYHDQKK